MKKKLLCAIVSAITIFNCVPANAWTANYGIRTYDSPFDYDSMKFQTTEYVTSNGINYLPYSLLKNPGINGAKVSYNASTQSITMENHHWISSARYFKAVFKANSNKVSINRDYSINTYLWEDISYAPKYINGELCIPVQSLTEIFSGRTSQDPKAGTISIVIPLR